MTFNSTTYALMPLDITHIESQMGMRYDDMVNVVRHRWDKKTVLVTVVNVEFRFGRPIGFQQVRFSTSVDETKDDFVEFMAELSLTHRILFVEKDGDGKIFVTESDDGQTNIDAELIELLANTAFGERTSN